MDDGKVADSTCPVTITWKDGDWTRVKPLLLLVAVVGVVVVDARELLRLCAVAETVEFPVWMAWAFLVVELVVLLGRAPLWAVVGLAMDKSSRDGSSHLLRHFRFRKELECHWNEGYWAE